MSAANIYGVANRVVADMRGDPGDTGQGALDVLGTIAAEELDYDDLCALAVELTRRVVAEPGAPE